VAGASGCELAEIGTLTQRLQTLRLELTRSTTPAA